MNREKAIGLHRSRSAVPFGALSGERTHISLWSKLFLPKQMLKFAKFTAIATVVSLTLAGSTVAQQSATASESGRKIATRVAPSYPPLAKTLHLQGVVRIEAVVRPNGSVKSTKVLGGNPVLADAAQQAIGKWKFEPAQEETTEVVQLTFVAQ